MPELIEKLRVAMVTISFVSTFSEPQNVEQGMSNYEVLFLFCLAVPMLVTNVPRGQILCIPSTFIIPCSTFDIQKSYPFNVLYLITFLYCTP
jgi:hypothetical protein